MGRLWIVGLGPGNREQRTFASEKAIEEADMVVGYGLYLDLIADLTMGKEVYSTPMTGELERADYAIGKAREGQKVAVVAGGDACVYGIGGLVLERMKAEDLKQISVTIIPGLTAALCAASLVGAPLNNDYLTLSLSDLLTPEDLILRRLRAAGETDLVIALYNPKSHKRTELILKARELLLQYRPASVPVAVVTNAYRKDEEVLLTTLGLMDTYMDSIAMHSLVVIGNSTTRRKGQSLISPRGYEGKYKFRSER